MSDNNGLMRVELLAVQTSLKNLLEAKHFSICTVDSILQVTRTVPDGRAYKALRLLHCIDYADMPRELLEEIPNLLAEVFRGPMLNMPGINFANDARTGRPVLRISERLQ